MIFKIGLPKVKWASLSFFSEFPVISDTSSYNFNLLIRLRNIIQLQYIFQTFPFCCCCSCQKLILEIFQMQVILFPLEDCMKCKWFSEKKTFFWMHSFCISYLILLTFSKLSLCHVKVEVEPRGKQFIFSINTIPHFQYVWMGKLRII